MFLSMQGIEGNSTRYAAPDKIRAIRLRISLVPSLSAARQLEALTFIEFKNAAVIFEKHANTW